MMLLSAEEVAHQLERAEGLRRLGELEAALAVLQPLRDHVDPVLAAEATYRTALVQIESGLPHDAIQVLDVLAARFPQTPSAERASFLGAIARRQAGDCAGALPLLRAYHSAGGLLAGHASFQLALCSQELGDDGAVLFWTEEVLRSEPTRLLRIEALERQAGALERSGDLAGALERYERLLGLSQTSSYRGTLLLTMARFEQDLGRETQSQGRLAALVRELPATRAAATALDRLVEQDAQNLVSYADAGLVRFNAGDYAAAIRNFDGALATAAEADQQPLAMFHRAVANVRLGAEGEGTRQLLGLPAAFPESPYAPMALLRAGRILESDESFQQAAAAYARVVSEYPSSPEWRDALLRLGLARLQLGATSEAAAALRRLTDSEGPPSLRALGQLWLGKIAAANGSRAEAQRHWQQAVDLSPRSYGGLRGQMLLSGIGLSNLTSHLDPGRFELTPEELADLDAWTSARGVGLGVSAADLAADATMARHDELLALGLRTEAAWERDELIRRYAGDPARGAALALALHQRGLTSVALLQARRAIDAGQVSPDAAPPALQKLLYPLPYHEVLIRQAEVHGADPLLFAALLWQESKFEPTARSSAGAMGLAQVMPATGEEIARALGRPDYNPEVLLRPTTALEFGAYYFGQGLRRFGGSVAPALAGYNAGHGTAERWTRAYGLDDPDLYIELIPYAETNHYVRIILETYAAYRDLYSRH